MEKRISFRDFQSAKNVAKTIDPYLIQKEKLQAQIDSLDETFNAKFKEKAEQLYKKVQEAQTKERERLEGLIKDAEEQICLYETGIFNNTGFHVTDLVKKVIEPTGKTDANGKPVKVTKYLPTGIVSYDEETKQYVITVPDETPTTENQPGSDFDKDAESVEGETLTEEEAKIEEEAAMIEPDGDDLPFGPTNEDEEF